MKKYITAAFLLSIIIVPLKAQKIQDLFRDMPDSIIPILTSDNRADCIDFLNSKMKAEVTNAFKTKSEMTDLTDDYIRIKMTNASTWQMKLLNVTDTTKIICVINTVYAPVADSDIHFYTTKWISLPTENFIKIPTTNNFFKVPISISPYDSIYNEYQKVRQIAEDILLIKIDAGKSKPTLTCTFTTPDFEGKDIAEKMKPFLKNPITFYWEKGKFVTK